jgi:hypothetical protein
MPLDGRCAGGPCAVQQKDGAAGGGGGIIDSSEVRCSFGGMLWQHASARKTGDGTQAPVFWAQ